MAVAAECVAEICLGLPDAEVESSTRHRAFKVRGRTFCWLLDDHHGDGRRSINAKASPGENARLAAEAAERFFVPDHLGARGWVGLWIDAGETGLDDVERTVLESYLLVAPKRLAASLRD